MRVARSLLVVLVVAVVIDSACAFSTSIDLSAPEKEIVSCNDTKADPNHIILRFLRHGWSCAQCCRDISLKLKLQNTHFRKCEQALLHHKDPLLTSAGISLLNARANTVAKCLPNSEWTLMSSAMTRTIETALHLFPKSNVLVVPFIKECVVGGDNCFPKFNLDPLLEDRLSENPEIQHKRLGSLASRVTYYKDDTEDAVVAPGKSPKSVEWTDHARRTSQAKFFAFLAKYAKKHNKRKFVLVTHSGVMMNLLMKLTGNKVMARNAEMWQTTLDNNGNFVKGTTHRVYLPVGTSGDCGPMTPEKFDETTKRCDW